MVVQLSSALWSLGEELSWVFVPKYAQDKYNYQHCIVWLFSLCTLCTSSASTILAPVFFYCQNSKIEPSQLTGEPSEKNVCCTSSGHACSCLYQPEGSADWNSTEQVHSMCYNLRHKDSNKWDTLYENMHCAVLMSSVSQVPCVLSSTSPGHTHLALKSRWPSIKLGKCLAHTKWIILCTTTQSVEWWCMHSVYPRSAVTPLLLVLFSFLARNTLNSRCKGNSFNEGLCMPTMRG